MSDYLGEQAAQAAKKQRRKRRLLRSTIVIIVVLAAVAGVGYFTWTSVTAGWTNPFSHEIADYPGPGGDNVDVDIPVGATGTEMGRILHTAGVVASTRAFTDAFAENPQSASIQPGTYRMQVQMRAADAVALLIDGERVEVNV
ncbi:MAG: endolytic transglycosylase MltG, partial [Cellulomonadaceae bacterium]|nr:endolytic transglycosylase MltG [Cellulomonadaceae bacterium]